MFSTTGIRFFLAAQIVIIRCNVSGSTPVVIVVVLMESETKQCVNRQDRNDMKRTHEKSIMFKGK